MVDNYLLNLKVQSNLENLFGDAQKSLDKMNSKYDKFIDGAIDKGKGLGDAIGGQLGDSLNGVLDLFGSKIKGLGVIGGGFAAAGVAVGLYANEIIKADTANRVYLETTGELNKEVIASTRALSQYSGEAEKDILRSSESFKKTFGVDSVTTINLIEEAFKKGANANGEFLDSLKEYSPQLKQIGLTGEQSIAFLTEAGRSGIFSDKAVDSVKEAGLRIKEMTKATSDSLKPLRDGVEQQIRQAAAAGKTWDVMKLISKELREGYLTSQQQATILADTFGSAGEDAGIAWVSSLDQINTKLGDFDDRISPLSNSTLKISEQWNLLKENIFGAESAIGGFITKATNGLAQILAGLNKLFKDDNPTGVSLFEYAFMSDKEKQQMLKSAQLNKLGVGFGPMEGTDEAIRAQQQFERMSRGNTLKKYTDKLKVEKGTPLAVGSTTSSLPKADTEKYNNVSKQLTINIEKQIETVHMTTENPERLMEMIQRAMTQLLINSQLSFA